MAYVKPQTLNGITTAVNAPEYKTGVDVKNGRVMAIDLITKKANLPTATEKVTSNLWMVNNVFTGDYSGMDLDIPEGDFVRLFYLPAWNEQNIQINDEGIKYASGDTYASISVGDVLEVDEEGKLEKVATPSAKIQFEVIDKIQFGNLDSRNGFLLHISVTE